MKTLNNFKKLALVTYLVLAFQLFSGWAVANAFGGDDQVITLKAKLIEKETNKPIVFANVFLANTNIGTVSNSDGEFILKVPGNHQNDEINISYMGFKSMKLKVGDFKISDETLLYMESEAVRLKELVVRTNDPITLIKGALKNIQENYGTTPYLCTAFYRESLMQNKQYVGIAEAVMQIYKSKYSNDLEQDRLKIFKGRKSEDVKKMDTLIFKLQGGHYVSLMLDLAKNPQSFMSQEYFDCYEFQPVSIANIEGKETYVIGFTQKKEVPEAFFDGRIYLDVATLAIKRVEFVISPTGLPISDQTLVKRKPANTEVNTVSGAYEVDYRELNGRWTLSHVRYEVKFKVDKKHQWFKKIYTSSVDLAITDKDTVNVSKFKLSESLKPNQVFADHVNEYYDENFWGDYNIIKPEESLQDAIDRISKKMKKYKSN
jgi:hypothetical protein